MDNENANIHVNKPSIDYIKYVPVIYPILIFLGYLNYDFYYKKFDIDIFNYLSINEFLFSFISQIYPIIFLIIGSFIWSLFYVFIEYMNRSIGEREREKKLNQLEDEFYLNFYKIEKSIYTTTFINAKSFLSDKDYKFYIRESLLGCFLFLIYLSSKIYPFLLFLLGFYLCVLPFIPLIFQNYDLDPTISLKTLLCISIGWLCLFLLLIKNLYDGKDINKFNYKFLNIVISVLLSISILIRYQNINAYNLENSKTYREVKFHYENVLIETNKEKKLLGITADYLFLRNIKTKTNYIYKLSDVKNLEITSLKKEEQINKEEK